jgi:hypothetical protein
MEYLLAYFIKLIGFFSFCLFLGILIKRSAFALGFLWLWFIIEKISYPIIKYAILKENNSQVTFIDKLYTFFPLESISNLIIEPFSRLNFVKTVGTQIGVDNIKDYEVHWYSVAIVLVWTAIFVSASYYLLKRRDL